LASEKNRKGANQMDEILGEVMKANRDLRARMQRSDLDMAYDAEHDMFLVTIGAPQEALTEEIRDHVHLRLDPDTLKIVGVTVTAFKRVFLKNEPELQKYFDTMFQSRVMMQTRRVPSDEKSRLEVTDALEHVVPT